MGAEHQPRDRTDATEAEETYEPPTLYVLGRLEDLTLANLKISGVSDGMSAFHNAGP